MKKLKKILLWILGVLVVLGIVALIIYGFVHTPKVEQPIVPTEEVVEIKALTPLETEEVVEVETKEIVIAIETEEVVEVEKEAVSEEVTSEAEASIEDAPVVEIPQTVTDLPWGVAFDLRAITATLLPIEAFTYDLYGYPVDASVADQEAFVSEATGCLVHKIEGEPAGFEVNYKPDSSECVCPEGWLCTIHSAENNEVWLWFGPETEVVFAETFRLVALNQPCLVLNGETQQAVDFEYTLWPHPALTSSCPVPTNILFHPELSEMREYLEEVYGLEVIYVGTTGAYQVTRLDRDPFEFTCLPDHVCAVTVSDTLTLLSGQSDLLMVTSAFIYPNSDVCTVLKVLEDSGKIVEYSGACP